MTSRKLIELRLKITAIYLTLRQVTCVREIVKATSVLTSLPYSWGRDYAECSTIQATLGVLHDIPGLIQLMGGKEAFSHYLLKACQGAPL